MIVNSRKQALFKTKKIQSEWSTFREIIAMTSRNGFCVQEVKGCFIASVIPWGNHLVKFIQIINFQTENSKFKVFAGSPFIKAKLTNV